MREGTENIHAETSRNPSPPGLFIMLTSLLNQRFFPHFFLPSTFTWDHKLFSKCVQVSCERAQVVPAPLFPLRASLFAFLLLNMPGSSPSLINPGSMGAVEAPVTSALCDRYKYRPGETWNPLVHPQTLTIRNISRVFVRNFVSILTEGSVIIVAPSKLGFSKDSLTRPGK